MAGNRIVAHYRDGRLLKGATSDFSPNREWFHVAAEGGGTPAVVRFNELKAVFFVRDLEGDPQHRSRNDFAADKPVVGHKIQVAFEDGEVMVGTTQGYQPGRPGFFVVPADPTANTERCFVIAACTREIKRL
jgi:hypothetical protein